MIKEYLTDLRHKRTAKKLDKLMLEMSSTATYVEYIKVLKGLM